MKRTARFAFAFAASSFAAPLFAAQGAAPVASDWAVVVLVLLVAIGGRIVDVRRRR
jgi:hypothetical protein